MEVGAAPSQFYSFLKAMEFLKYCFLTCRDRRSVGEVAEDAAVRRVQRLHGAPVSSRRGEAASGTRSTPGVDADPAGPAGDDVGRWEDAEAWIGLRDALK